MSDLTPSEETAYGLMTLVGSDPKFKAKLDELVAARQEAETAAKNAKDEIGRLEQARKDTAQATAKAKSELAVSQAEHDKSADEAAARIAAQNSQMKEILRVKAEAEATQRTNAEKEKGLSDREKILADQLAGLAVMRKAAEAQADLVRRQKAHMAAMPQS